MPQCGVLATFCLVAVSYVQFLCSGVSEKFVWRSSVQQSYTKERSAEERFRTLSLVRVTRVRTFWKWEVSCACWMVDHSSVFVLHRCAQRMTFSDSCRTRFTAQSSLASRDIPLYGSNILAFFFFFTFWLFKLRFFFIQPFICMHCTTASCCSCYNW